MATRDKNIWILILFILAGIVVGGLLGELASRSRLSLVVRIWRKLWTWSARSIRPKYNITNIRNTIQNKHSKHYRYCCCTIHI